MRKKHIGRRALVNIFVYVVAVIAVIFIAWAITKSTKWADAASCGRDRSQV